MVLIPALAQAEELSRVEFLLEHFQIRLLLELFLVENARWSFEKLQIQLGFQRFQEEQVLLSG